MMWALDDGAEVWAHAYNDLHEYDIASRTWTELSTPIGGAIPSSRSSPGIATYNGFLYIFGGYAGAGAGLNDLHAVGFCGTCSAGKYLNGQGSAGLCDACGTGSYSLAGSYNLTDCICNIGYEGPNGSVCLACTVGKYKPVNGSGPCFACPAHTDSRAGSGAVTDCVCNVGYEGQDGAACSACVPGWYKAANGSG
eukprot:241070-Rhodomonas_salina.2